MENLRKFAFIKIALFRLVFLLVSFSSIYALAETRINSAKSLAEIGDKRAIEPLKSALTEEKDEDVKKAFEEAIGN